MGKRPLCVSRRKGDPVSSPREGLHPERMQSWALWHGILPEPGVFSYPHRVSSHRCRFATLCQHQAAPRPSPDPARAPGAQLEPGGCVCPSRPSCTREARGEGERVLLRETGLWRVSERVCAGSGRPELFIDAIRRAVLIPCHPLWPPLCCEGALEGVRPLVWHPKQSPVLFGAICSPPACFPFSCF